MRNEDLQKLSDYFHDGSIIDIKQTGRDIEIAMHSAEITEDLNVPLSQYNRIKGILFVNGVESIVCNDIPFVGELTKPYDDGGIVDFTLRQNGVKLAISWDNYPPNPKINEFSDLEIKAKSITWKTIPDLMEPEW